MEKPDTDPSAVITPDPRPAPLIPGAGIVNHFNLFSDHLLKITSIEKEFTEKNTEFIELEKKMNVLKISMDDCRKKILAFQSTPSIDRVIEIPLPVFIDYASKNKDMWLKVGPGEQRYGFSSCQGSEDYYLPTFTHEWTICNKCIDVEDSRRKALVGKKFPPNRRVVSLDPYIYNRPKITKDLLCLAGKL